MAENQERPMAGRAVEGAGNVVEKTAQQVEGAVVEATEFASDNVAGRLIGYLRAGKSIAEAIAQGGLDTASGGADLVLRELDEMREKIEQAVKDAAK